jgi:hypothetical protein
MICPLMSAGTDADQDAIKCYGEDCAWWVVHANPKDSRCAMFLLGVKAAEGV